MGELMRRKHSQQARGTARRFSLRGEPPGKGVPGMTVARLARRLGLDGNPLRRRTDKISGCLTALLVVVFLIGAPVLSVTAIGWAGRAGAIGRQVSAVLRQAAPAPSFSKEVLGSSQVSARWTAPNGRPRAGAMLVGAGVTVGHTVPRWVDAAGSPTGPPPSRGTVLAREVTAGVVATVALGIVLWCLAKAGQWVLDRRRFADWEAAWAPDGHSASGFGTNVPAPSRLCQSSPPEPGFSHARLI